jgi:hypothetical protein
VAASPRIVVSVRFIASTPYQVYESRV